MSDVTFQSPQISGEEDYFSSGREEMRQYVKRSARKILDVGCGSGQFLAGLQGVDSLELWGVELNPLAAENAAKIFTKVFNARVEEVIDQLPDAYFDCICLNDVLEHLVDPWHVLRELRKKLTREGEIVASIPNVRHYRNLWRLLVEAEWEYESAGILDRTHLRFFTKKSVARLFNETGYSVTMVLGLRPSRKWKAKIWAYLSAGSLADIRFPQFAITAKVKK